MIKRWKSIKFNVFLYFNNYWGFESLSNQSFYAFEYFFARVHMIILFHHFILSECESVVKRRITKWNLSYKTVRQWNKSLQVPHNLVIETKQKDYFRGENKFSISTLFGKTFYVSCPFQTLWSLIFNAKSIEKTSWKPPWIHKYKWNYLWQLLFPL